MRQKYNNFFGEFGGRYVAEILRPSLDELEEAFVKYIDDPSFCEKLSCLQKSFIGRPTPLSYAKNISKEVGGAKIYLKLEGLANTGAHKINNALGQALLAKRMGKTKIIAETGAGQHGVAVACVCAKLGLHCTIFMGEVDIKRQMPNVFLMKMFGACVVPVDSGSKTLKDAVNEALRQWAKDPLTTHYLLGSALGPSPFPDMVREFQSVIGKETKLQLEEKGADVEALIACVGGGSNAIGFFYPFIDEKRPKLIGVEAGGVGSGYAQNATRMDGGSRVSIVHGYKSFFLTDADGQVAPTRSISAGLDYPGIGPQLAFLGSRGRVTFTSATDRQALDAVELFAKKEGLILALESAHAAAVALQIAAKLPSKKAVVVNMSGRGDKDLFILAKNFDKANWSQFLRRESE